MTLELTPLAGPATVDWASPDRGLWVASTRGEFLGMIERHDGRYVTSDSRGRRLGTFDELSQAQIAVDHHDDSHRLRREVVMLKVTIALAAASAVGLAYGVIMLALQVGSLR